MFEDSWWIIQLVMMIFCLFMMRGRSGSSICGFGSHKEDSNFISDSNSAMEILEKRYALGKIEREEYEEKKKELNHAG